MTITRRLRGSPDPTTLVTVASSALILLSTLLSGMVLARTLGPGGRGEVASLLLWGSVALDVGALGTPLAVAFFARNTESREVDSRGLSIVARAYPILLSAGLVVLAVIWTVASPSFGPLSAVVVVGWMAFRLVYSPLIRFAQGSGQMRVFNSGRLIGDGAAVIGLALLGISGFLTPTLTLLTYSVAVAGAAVYVRVQLGDSATSSSGRPVPRSFRSAFWKYSAWSLSSVLALKLNRSIDVFLLSIAATSTLVGTYVVAASSAGAIAVIGLSLGLDLFPRLRKQQLDHRALVNRFLLVNASVTIPVVSVFVVFAPVIVPLVYGSAFSPAVLPARILAIGTIGLASSYVLSEAIRALGRPRAVTFGQIAGGSVTLLSVLITGTSDLSLVAAAASAGYLVTAFVQYLAVLKFT